MPDSGFFLLEFEGQNGADVTLFYSGRGQAPSDGTITYNVKNGLRRLASTWTGQEIRQAIILSLAEKLTPGQNGLVIGHLPTDSHSKRHESIYLPRKVLLVLMVLLEIEPPSEVPATAT